jgi:hypothetical protein
MENFHLNQPYRISQRELEKLLISVEMYGEAGNPGGLISSGKSYVSSQKFIIPGGSLIQIFGPPRVGAKVKITRES